jgi:alpha-L-rhamnosidase
VQHLISINHFFTASEAGRADVAFGIVNQTTFPGWGYMLERGATTLWEHWEFSDNTFSHNHPMFGSVSEWFYRALAGINAAPDAVGFDNLIIRPQPVGDLKWVKASYDSVRGKIVSEWRRDASKFNLRVRVPVGATAMVVLPSKEGTPVTEHAKPVERAPGVERLLSASGNAVLMIGSGDYEFVSEP